MTVIIDGGGSKNNYIVKSLAKYIQRIGYIKAKNHLTFRGLSDCDFSLVPSLDRKIKDDEPYRKWTEAEYKLVEFSEQRFPESFVKNTPALLIANMQHYGIPTRMMDVSGNALVALYFACDKTEKDGQVIVFDEEIVSAYNPYVNAIADTYRITKNTPTDIDTYRYHVYKQNYFSSLVYPDWENIHNQNDFYNMELLKKPIVVDVGSLNQRQINQSGKFIIFPNEFYKDSKGKESISDHLIKVNKDSSFIKAIINIPKEEKAKILETLELVGITKDFLFPDNTEIVCNSIKQTIRNEMYYPSNLKQGTRLS